MPKLVAFSILHANARYSWRKFDVVSGFSPEDVAQQAVEKLYQGKRNCKDKQDILLCLKGIIESIMSNRYNLNSSQQENTNLYKSDSDDEIKYENSYELSPEDEILRKEYITSREKDLYELIEGDKEIEQYIEALMSVPDLEDNTQYLANKLGVTPKEIYRIRRKIRRHTGRSRS